MRSVFIAAITLAAAAAAHADDPYLYDALKKPAYRAGWNAMMQGARPPAWLAAFSRGGNGVATPATRASVGGRPVELFFVCKPHDCGSNKLQVLFDAGGGRARGALVVDDGPPRFLGGPDAAEKAALLAALNN